MVIIAAVLSFINQGASAVWPAMFALFTLAGCAVSGLLLWHELDEYNPVLQQICSVGKKANCSAILNSKASRIAGISWSTIGFTYFMAGLIILLFEGLTDKRGLSMLSLLNLMALPYIFYSIYYQWCQRAGISSTPTFFISLPKLGETQSGFQQLPEMYTVNDLKYSLFV